MRSNASLGERRGGRHSLELEPLGPFATFLEEATLRRVQALAPTLHVHDGLIDEGSGQRHRHAVDPTLELCARLTLAIGPPFLG